MPEVNLNKDNFNDEVKNSKDLVLVDFWASWCGPCKMLAPVLEDIAKEYDGKGFKVGKVNIEENEPLANEYHIMNIPTMLFFKNGEIVEQMSGFMPKEELKKKIDSLI